MKSVCASFGLDLNMSPKKTEVVVQFRGRGAPAVKQQLRAYMDKEGVIHLPSSVGAIRLVPCYGHLGAKIEVAKAFSKELPARASSMRAATSALNANVFAQAQLSAHDRTSVAATCVHTCGTYLSGVWFSITASMFKQVAVQYDRPLRRILGQHRPPLEFGKKPMTSKAIRAFLKVPRFEAVALAEKMRLAARIAQLLPCQVLALVQSQGGASGDKRL